MITDTHPGPGSRATRSARAGPWHASLALVAVFLMLLSSGVVGVGSSPAVAATVTPIVLAPPPGYEGHNMAFALDGDIVAGRVADEGGWNERAVAWNLATDPPTTILLPSLGPCSGSYYDEAIAVSGTYVVGSILTDQCVRQAVVWNVSTRPPTVTGLGTLGGLESMATAISGTTAVGWAYTATNAVHAAAWDVTGDPPTITDLGTLTTGFGDGSRSDAVAIDGDIVAGTSYKDGLDHPVAWNLGTTPPTITDLGVIDSVPTTAADVSGTVIVGNAHGSWIDEAFAYDLANPGLIPLGNFDGYSLGDRYATAVSGTFVVGTAPHPWTDATHAVVWDVSTTPRTIIGLGTLSGDDLDSSASDIDGHFAVGWADVTASTWHAALWNLTVSPPTITDLGSLGRMSSANAVQGNRAVGEADVLTPNGDYSRAVAWDLPNAAPVAVGDEYATDANEALVVSAADGVLANDLDGNDDVLSASVVRNVAHGTLTLAGDGSFVYTPTAGYVGSDWFTYHANDGTAGSNDVTVAITVTPATLAETVVSGPLIEMPPKTIATDAYDFRFDDVVSSPQTGARLSWVPENDKVKFSAQIVGEPSHYITFAEGEDDVCALDATAYAYTAYPVAPDDPTNGFVLIKTNGTPPYYIAIHVDEVRPTTGVATDLDAIWYFQTDASGTFCDVANPAPVAADDAYTIAEATTLTVPALTGVLANDTDEVGDPLIAVLDSAPSTGKFGLAADGSFTYTPPSGFTGPVTFTYHANDGTNDSDVATVTITVTPVTPVNDPPIAVADDAVTDEDTTLTVPTPGVLGNDTDADGDSLSATLVTDVSHGDLTLNSDGSYTYTPDADVNGTDTFTYTAGDGTDESAPATVTITVTPVNDAPIAVSDTYVTDEDAVLTVPALGVLANDSDVDGDDLVAIGVGLPAHGTVALATTGSFSYAPEADFNGTDSFTYRAYDGHDSSDVVTVTITVTPRNDAPIAVSDTYVTDEDAVLTVPALGVLANDTDVDDDVLTASKITAPSHGTVTLVEDGSFTYDPGADFNGTDTFSYRVSDGSLFDTATVTITVTPVNDPPVVSLAPTARTVQYSDGITAITVTATDIDSAAATITANGLPAGLGVSQTSCNLNLIGAGSTCTAQITGTAAVAAGTYPFSASADDGNDVSSPVSGSISVVAENASVSFDADNPVSRQVDDGEEYASAVTMVASVVETEPDLAEGTPAAGDLDNAIIGVRLVPVGPGNPISGTCAGSTTGMDYDQVRIMTCTFTEVPVNTYTVEVSVTGGYYTGLGEDVFTVYDPDAGFATGGGWFEWPGTGDRTNFGFTMKYNRKGTSVQGSLLMIRHLPDGSIYRVKSNALYGLAVGTDSDDSGTYGWASFAGKSTYLEPDWLEPIGNQGFVVAVTDRNEPGTGVDTFEIRMLDQPKLSISDPVEIRGGNIVVPHDAGGRPTKK